MVLAKYIDVFFNFFYTLQHQIRREYFNFVPKAFAITSNDATARCCGVDLFIFPIVENFLL